MKKSIEWKPISNSVTYSTRVFEVQSIKSISPHGEEKTFISLKSPEWVIVVPIVKKNNEKYFVMVRQWRHGTSCVLQEFPGGVVNEGEALEIAAKRELEEETGYKAIKIEKLDSLFPNPAIMQNMCHIFFAECEEHEGEQHLDDDEYIEISLVPYKDVIMNMGKPPFQHALMSSAMFLYLQKYEMQELIKI
ncbi:MAG: NUDIX hydrolase [Treponema sp.]